MERGCAAGVGEARSGDRSEATVNGVGVTNGCGGWEMQGHWVVSAGNYSNRNTQVVMDRCARESIHVSPQRGKRDGIDKKVAGKVDFSPKLLRACASLPAAARA